jgi:hypothetical protein
MVVQGPEWLMSDAENEPRISCTNDGTNGEVDTLFSFAINDARCISGIVVAYLV